MDPFNGHQLPVALVLASRGQVTELEVAEVAEVRLLTRVYSNMSCQVTFGCKLLATIFTLKRFFTRVSSFVLCESLKLNKTVIISLLERKG